MSLENSRGEYNVMFKDPDNDSEETLIEIILDIRELLEIIAKKQCSSPSNS